MGIPGKWFWVFLLSSSLMAAGDTTQWPAWRGAGHDGIAHAKNLPTVFEGEKAALWRQPLPGAGPSTPVIWDDRIFLSSAEGKEGLIMMALDLKGKEVWRKAIDGKNYDIRRGESNAAASSPVTDGKHVWFLFGTGHLVCLDVNGAEKWRMHLVETYGKFNMYHGYASSPLLREGKLYLQLMHTDAQLILALDAATGKLLWKHDRASDAKVESLHSYASPIPFDGKKDQALIIHGSDYVTAHAYDDGRELWRCGGLQNPLNYNNYFRLVTTPVVSDGLLVVPSAKNGPVWGLRPDGARGRLDDQKSFQAWKMPEKTSDVPSPVIADGLVYMCRENGILICIDAKSGEVVYQERLHPGNHRASPVLADNKLYFAAGDGTITVVRPGRQFEILAKSKLSERIAASPIVAGNRLYIRTYEAIYAFGER